MEQEPPFFEKGALEIFKQLLTFVKKHITMSLSKFFGRILSC